jgi:hypothetical protein
MKLEQRIRRLPTWLQALMVIINIILITGFLAVVHGQSAPLQTILDYCIANADRVANGTNVIQDLIKSGIIEDIGDWTCQDVAKEKERITNEFIQEQKRQEWLREHGR